MTTVSLARWNRAVQYRHPCAMCGRDTMVAVIKRRNKQPVRVCRTCFVDGFWKGLP